MTRDELITYVRDFYSVEPDYPFEEEDVFVFRHVDNRKWFAVAMAVPYHRLGLDSPGTVDIVDVKCGPLLMGSYRKQPGILPGYHMNKENWVTVLLDGTAENETIRELMEISYELTKKRKKETVHRADSF